MLDIKGELYEATADYRRRLGKVFVIDPEAVGNRFDPLHGRYTERQLYASAKYLLYEAGERDPIFIQRGMKMLTQLFLAAREENRLAGYEKYRLLPYAGQLMNLPINQVAAHVQAVSPELVTKFLSGAYDPEKDYDEKKFLTSSWDTATNRLYPILSDELLRCFDGSDFTASELMLSPKPVTVYLRLPEADLEALAPVVRLFFQTIIHDAITTYDKRKGSGCFPLLLLLDEAGTGENPAPLRLRDHGCRQADQPVGRHSIHQAAGGLRRGKRRDTLGQYRYPNFLPPAPHDCEVPGGGVRPEIGILPLANEPGRGL